MDLLLIEIPKDIKDLAHKIANSTNEVDIESFEKGYIQGCLHERFKITKKTTYKHPIIIDEMLKILKSYGFIHYETTLSVTFNFMFA